MDKGKVKIQGDYYRELCEAFNYNSFFDFLIDQKDVFNLGYNLEAQLAKYVKRCGDGYEQNKSDFNTTYVARERWLKHTIFICTDKYRGTKKEIFAEVVYWAENWKEKYLHLFDPYSPQEHSEFKKAERPLWQMLNEDDSTQPQGLPCLPQYSDKLKPIFKELRDAGFIHKTAKESDFVKAFQAGALTDWERIRWTGSNPAVSTLVNRLTLLKAVPSLVNQLFITKTPYHNNSGKRVNEDIKAILKPYT